MRIAGKKEDHHTSLKISITRLRSMTYYFGDDCRVTCCTCSSMATVTHWVLWPYLTLSWRWPLPCRNQSIGLQSKSMDWFLYDNGHRHERVKIYWLVFCATFWYCLPPVFLFHFIFMFKNTRMLSELQASFLNFGFSSFTLAAI